MAGATVSYALGKLDVLVNMGFELYNVREEIRLIQLELRMIEGFLQDADSKCNRNPAVNQWMNEVREVAYRIGSAIDTFLVDIEGNHRRRFGHFSKLVRLVKKLFKLKKLNDEVKSIRKTLKTISQVRADLGIINAGAVNDENDGVPFRPTRPEEIDDSEVVGLDSDKDNIIRHLLDRNDSRRSVLSIVGIGGLGKTTLAKKVYESTELAGEFDCKIWLSISQKFNVNDLLRKILYTIEPELQNEEPAIEDNNLTSALQGFLKRKRYFIILDDVWKTDLWERMKIVLLDESNASRVLITSRFLDVAKAADVDTKPYKLRYLNEDKSLELLFSKAFPNRESRWSYQRSVRETSDQIHSVQHYPDLSEVAEQLTKKCAGLPLALIVLGGILSKREPNYTAWQMVNNTMNWHNDATKLCTQVLHLSYADLPNYLKQCFLYFASFPEDYKISAKHVTRMWIAEGFISKDGGGTMEDRAGEFLEELVQRCLVEVVKRSWNGNCKICGIHDLLRDMAIHEAKKDNFFTLLSKADDCSQLASETVHRASLQYTTPPNYSIHSTSIRSLLCFGQYISNYHGFRQLKVLTIERVDMVDKKINYEGLFQGLIHLRYFGFRYCRLPVGFERISFGSTTNLETIDCKGTEVAFPEDSTPLSLWEVPTLKHVIIGKGKYIAKGRPHLPSKWNHLKSLQTLKWVRLENFPKLELEYDINLRTLGINAKINASAVEEGWHTLKNLLKRTNHLVSLSLRNVEGFGLRCVPFLTEGTSDLPCHETIQCLYLTGKWERDICVLKVGMLPTNLSKLTLLHSMLEEDPMPILEKLRSLRILRLLPFSFTGTKLTCTKDGFPSLQNLELRILKNLNHWDIKRGAMRRLSQLTIMGCFDVVPDLHNVPTLQDLTLDKHLYEISQAEDHCKIKHIPSVSVKE